MPVKTKRIHHRPLNDKRGNRRSKRFLRVYAPYIPLLLIVATGFVISLNGSFRQNASGILGYATRMNSSELLDSTNNERISKQARPLQLNDKLALAAQKKAEDMAARNYWSHTTPDGQEPWIFIQQSGYSYIEAAENLAYGFSSSESATIGWMNSPSHRANLLNDNLSEVGFGIVNVANYQNNGPQTIVVAMYGKPLPSLVTTTGLAPPPAPTTLGTTEASPSAKKITLAQTITKGYLPWINFVCGILLGSIAVFLLTKHTINFRRTIRQSERFILHHPLLDVTLVAMFALTALVSQTTGVIH